MHFTSYFGIVYILFLFINQVLSHSPKNSKVILVSFDGFRWDYIDKANSAGYRVGNFSKLISNGVTVGRGGITNVFPTKTLVNHLSIVTGLYAESHGIVANVFYDPLFKEMYNISTRNSTSMDAKWYGNVQPLWVVNENQGGKTGCYYWFGCSANFSGIFPTLGPKGYNETVPLRKRITEIVLYLLKGANLALLYFHEPDTTGHMFGPDSDEILKVVESLNDDVGYLVHTLEEYDLFEEVNLILTSDHGMANADDVINLDDFVDPSEYNGYQDNSHGTPFILIDPLIDEAKLYEKFSKVQHTSVYRREDIPSRYHYRNNRRILPLLVVADVGFQLVFNTSSPHIPRAQHGYDNAVNDMHQYFIAHGPAFKKHFTPQTPFQSIDIFPLVCHLLHLEIPPNNGSLVRVVPLLKYYEPRVYLITSFSMLLAFVVCASVSGVIIFSLVCCGAPRRFSEIMKDINESSDVNSWVRRPLLDS